ncbi:MAG: hypothetical protein HQ546_05380 [Planctomycetes bacterium]|nr:hypothetical protein [Planctomycetota bacterium]
MTPRQFNAIFRPLVDRAWCAHCDLVGTAPNNRQARDDWYREKLWSICRIRTTKDADNQAHKKLIDRFTMLSEAGDVPEIDGLSDAQNAVFSQLAESAWRAVSKRHGTDLQFPEWLAAELEQCHVVDHSVANNVEHFDELMSHFAVIAGDAYWIERTATASEIRMQYLIRQKMVELSDLEGQPVDWNYCRSIYRHMHLPLTMEDAEVGWLWKVFQAMDTHVRRLRHSTALASR